MLATFSPASTRTAFQKAKKGRDTEFPAVIIKWTFFLSNAFPCFDSSGKSFRASYHEPYYVCGPMRSRYGVTSSRRDGLHPAPSESRRRLCLQNRFEG